MAELLLELFSEEIPARMQSKASSDLKNALLAKLKNLDIKFEQADAYSTPRRLTIHIQGLPLNLPEVREEKKGPKVNAPESAISGFLGSSGLNKDQLEIRKVGNDEVYFAVTTKAASESSQVLITIINDLIAEFTWPKSMRWGEHKIRWVRPLKNILCLFDKKVLPVSFGHLIANNKTWGHRFLGSQFTAEDFGSYSNQLRVNKVILSADERKQLILEQAQKIAAENNFLLRQEDALLEEVTGLVEWPIVMLGKIDKEFMHIPKEVLITSMRSHQKYFSLENADKNFAPYFIFVANIEASDGGKKIIQGNERVLRARLADAKFFYELDLNMTLENMIPKLAKVTFHAKLGNILEKVERMKHVAKILPGNRIINFRAIELSKADLMSQMVGEFPELQGIMGYYYAIADQEDQKVATAIRDHYKPISQDDEVPKDQVAINVALADRIVTIVGFFIIGEKPNGSKDPYALRRAAIGIIRIILENKLDINIERLINQTANYFKLDENIINDLLDFFADRLKFMMKADNVRHDIISAVFNHAKSYNLYKIAEKAKALQQFLTTDTGNELLSAYIRASNIVTIEEKKDKVTYDGSKTIALDVDLTEEDKQLSATLANIAPNIENYIKNDNYLAALKDLEYLRVPINNFFNNVLVNTENRALRDYRLNTLAKVRKILNVIADFSLIEG